MVRGSRIPNRMRIMPSIGSISTSGHTLIAYRLNKPRIQATWNVLPHNSEWFAQWKEALERHRATTEGQPAWAAPFRPVR